VRVDYGPWKRLHSKANPEIEDAAFASAASASAPSASSSPAPTVVLPIWLALAEDETEGLRRLKLLHSSLEETGNDDDEREQEDQQTRPRRRRRRPRSELATARRRAERSLVRACLLRFSRENGASVVATAETATRCAASAVAAAAAGAGAALPLEVAGCDRRFCLQKGEEEENRSVTFVRPFVSVPASDVEAAARLLGLTTGEKAGREEGEEEEREESDGVLAAAADFLRAAQLRVPSTATSVVAALGKLAPCGWAGRKKEDAKQAEPPSVLCDLCAAGPWASGDGAEVELEEEEEEEKEESKSKKLTLRLCYPCSTVALGAPPAPAGAAPVVPKAAARKMARALFGGDAGREDGLWGRR